MADSLVAILDRLEWVISTPTTVLDLDLFADEPRLGASRFLPNFNNGMSLRRSVAECGRVASSPPKVPEAMPRGKRSDCGNL
jgi:hypothetical protein